MLQGARAHVHRWFCPFHSRYATGHSHWHLEADHEVSIYTQEIGKCHVSGLLKIQYFLRAGLPPDSHCKHKCAHSHMIFLDKLYQVSSDKKRSAPWVQTQFFQNDIGFIFCKLDLMFIHLFSYETGSMSWAEKMHTSGNVVNKSENKSFTWKLAREWRWVQVWMQTHDVVCRLTT